MDRQAAMLLAGSCVVTAFLYHPFLAYPDFFSPDDASRSRGHFWQFLKNFGLVGGLILVVFSGTLSAPRACLTLRPGLPLSCEAGHSIDGSPLLRALICGLTLSAPLVGAGAAAHATSYNEGVSGDLSHVAGTPTLLGDLSLGSNAVIGWPIPSGAPIPNGHGASTNQNNDSFTFTVPMGDVLSRIIWKVTA